MRLQLQRILLRSWRLQRTTIRYVKMWPSIHLKKLKTLFDYPKPAENTVKQTLAKCYLKIQLSNVQTKNILAHLPSHSASASEKVFLLITHHPDFSKDNLNLPSSLTSFFLLFFADGHQRELPDHVGHYLQSLTPPASCDTHQDRLEQDPELQDRQGDAERLKTTENITDDSLPTPSQTTLHDWIVVLSLYRNWETGDKERFGLTTRCHITHWMSTFSKVILFFIQTLLTPLYWI